MRNHDTDRLLRLAPGDPETLLLALREMERNGAPLSAIEAAPGTLREALDLPGCIKGDARRIALVARANASRLLLVVRDAKARLSPELVLFWVRWHWNAKALQNTPWHIVITNGGPVSICGRQTIELTCDGEAVRNSDPHQTLPVELSMHRDIVTPTRTVEPVCGSCLRVFRGRNFQSNLQRHF